MNKTLSADQLSRYVGMRIRNPAAADRYWATCVGRRIAVDASIDDETGGKLKEFLKTKLSPGDHAQVCDMLEAAGSEPEAEDDDLPQNAVESLPASKNGPAGVPGADAAFKAQFPGLAHIKIDNSGLPIPRRRAAAPATDVAAFNAMFPGLAHIKQA